MSEIEFNVRGFINAALETTKDKGGTVFYTIVDKNKQETDVFVADTNELIKSLCKIFKDKIKINNISEIQIKTVKGDTYTIINKIEIS